MKQLAAIGCVLSLMFGYTAPVAAETDVFYRQLQDYAIFNGNGNINWCGGKNLEVFLLCVSMSQAALISGQCV